MSSSGPSADAKKAQAAALEELEAAQKKKRTLDGQLVRLRLATFDIVNPACRDYPINRYARAGQAVGMGLG